MGIFKDNAVKDTKTKEWTPVMVKDVMLMGAICTESGWPRIVEDSVVMKAVENLEKQEGVASRQIIEFVLRGIERGWITIAHPYGYK